MTDDLAARLDELVDTDPLRLRDEALALLHRAEQAEAERDQARAEARRHLEHLRMAHPNHFEVNVIGERMCGCGGQWPCPAPDKRAEQAEAEVKRLRAELGQHRLDDETDQRWTALSAADLRDEEPY